MKRILLLLITLGFFTASKGQTSFNIALRKCVKYTDTSAMLSKYLRKTDTANIRFRPVAGSNITLSGTYPNITIAASGGGGSVDTTSLSNRINTKLNISDTANIRFRPVAGSNITLTGTYPNITIAASGVGPSIDTTSLSNRINTKLNISDTANIRFRPVAGSNITLSGTYPNITIASSGGGSLTPWRVDSIADLYIGNSSNLLNSNGVSLNPISLTGTQAVNALSINQTWNTTGNPSLIFANVTNTASGNLSTLLNLQVGGTPVFRVFRNNGNVSCLGSIESGNSQFIGFSSRSVITSSSNGNLRISNNSQNDFNLLQFGLTTSLAPALKRSSANLEVRLADDSGFTAIQSLYDRFGSGSPEGIVTAPVGAVYHRTDGGANTSLYVKESGSGNTGWVAK